MVREGGNAQRFLTENTMSIHFYGRRIRAFIRHRYAGIPHPDSMIGQLVAKHGIDPHAAPLRSLAGRGRRTGGTNRRLNPAASAGLPMRSLRLYASGGLAATRIKTKKRRVWPITLRGSHPA